MPPREGRNTTRLRVGLRGHAVFLDRDGMVNYERSGDAKMSPSKNPLVSVVVPTRRRPKTLERCLTSILQSSYQPLEVVVVDDFSDEDPTRSLLQLHPQLKVVRNEKRMLLAASRNIGVSKSNGELIFFVDDDNVIARDAIAQLVSCATSERAGVVAPLIYYASDPDRIWYAGSWMSPISAVSVFAYRGRTDVRLENPYETSLFHDAFMVKRSVFETIGMFDQKRFPIYLSEADYAERMRKRNLVVMVNPKAHVWHDVPVLRGTQNLLRHVHITEPSRAYYVARNRIVFMRMYRGVMQNLIFLAFFVPALSALHLASILSSKNAAKVYFARYYLGGIIAGLRIR